MLFDDCTSTLSPHGIKVICDFSSFKVIVGLLMGSILPNIFASLAMQAVGRADGQVVQEVRRQLREMQGTQRPNYGRCVDVVTHQLHDATHAGGSASTPRGASRASAGYRDDNGRRQVLRR